LGGGLSRSTGRGLARSGGVELNLRGRKAEITAIIVGHHFKVGGRTRLQAVNDTGGIGAGIDLVIEMNTVAAVVNIIASHVVADDRVPRKCNRLRGNLFRACCQDQTQQKETPPPAPA